MNLSPHSVTKLLRRQWQARLAAFVVASALLSLMVAATGATSAQRHPLPGAAAGMQGPAARTAPAGPRGPIEQACAPGKPGVIGAEGPAGPQGPVGAKCAPADPS
jgi:hypothetical protein